MTQVTFYLLEDEGQDAKEDKLTALTCSLAANCYRNKQRCVVLFDSKQAAEQFDEVLWQLPVDGFIPHNLTSEGPANGAPVEIAWESPAQVSRPILINMTDSIPQNAQRYKQIIDFVPATDALKQQARERYKQYRAAGYQLDTQPASSINES